MAALVVVTAAAAVGIGAGHLVSLEGRQGMAVVVSASAAK